MNIHNGQIKDVTLGATAGNSAGYITSPTGKKYLVLYGQAKCVNDATVANRYILTEIVDSTNAVIFRFPTASTALTASQTNYNYYYCGNYANNISTSGLCGIWLGSGIWLGDGDKIKFSVNGGVAGDVLTAWFKVMEFPE